VIIAGHGRTMAAQRLEMKEVPCLRLSHLTDAQKKAYVIADNKLALNAGWDDEMLAIELQELSDVDFDLSLTGFDDAELAALMAEAVQEGLTDEDSVPDAPEIPITVEGDVWLLGNHRLMCGDSTSVDAVDKLMNNKIAQMVFTDPPYRVSYQSNKRVKSDKFDVLKNDDVILDIAPIIEIFSKGWVFIWTSWKVLPQWLEQFVSFGYPTNQIIWFKGGGGIGDLEKTFSSDYETALVWNRGAKLLGKRIGSVWSINKDGAATYLHPTQKPVSLAVEALDKTTNSSMNILDLFGGSGSTLIACEKLSRNGFIMELDPKYCDVIIKRWQDFTGKTAIHEQTNKKYNQLEADKCKAA
jgi:DNA modification methylase